jgi:DNA-binding transcriptional ArsR family regulator
LSKNISDDAIDLVFHAISDRTRRALLARLAHSPAMVTELAKPFAMSLPAVSKHLRVLQAAGLVARRVDGRVHRCSLSASPLAEAERWFNQYRIFWKEALDGLAHYAEQGKKKKINIKKQ